MALTIRASRILGSAGGFDYFDSEAKPFNELTPAELVITAGDAAGPLPDGIVFDNFVWTNGSGGNGWVYGYTSGRDQFGIPFDHCNSLGRIPPQEWGPSELGFTSPYLLPSIDLGPAPDGTDHLELAVNLTRSVTPDLSSQPGPLITDWPIEITEGAQIECEGASCVLEHEAGMSRMLWLDLVDGRILLRRKQSITSGTPVSGYPGFYTHFIDNRSGGGSQAGNSVGLGKPNQCSIVNTADYRSVYTGTLIITPANYTGPSP